MSWERHFRQLEQGIQVSIPLDDDGYLDRECPHSECESQFKILADDWSEKVRDEEVFCPICGHTAESDQWLTQEQVEHVQNVGMREVQKALGNAMKDWSRDFNRKAPKKGFITMSMKYKSSPLPVVMPIDAAELMQQRYDCEKCSCRYAAVGAAFFCPSCGHNSARSAFKTSIETIRKSVDKLPEIYKTLEDSLGKDAAANTSRHMLEGNLVKIVASFQRFAEATFQSLPSAVNVKLKRNVFQRLDDSSELWRDAIGKGYEDMLTQNELGQLHRLFQQRHILEHQDGVVDDRYIDKTDDRSYVSGQRLVIKPDYISSCCDIVTRLAQSINTLIIQSPSSPEGGNE